MTRFLKIFLLLICILATPKRVYTPVLVFSADTGYGVEKTEAVNYK